MNWGIWHKTSPRTLPPLRTCEAITYDDAWAKLAPHYKHYAVKVEPLCLEDIRAERFYIRKGGLSEKAEVKNPPAGKT